jgi:hypothetical protein
MRSVEDALEVLEAGRRIARPAVETQASQAVAPDGDNGRLRQRRAAIRDE